MLGSWVRAPGGSLFKTAKMHKALIIKHYRSFFFYIKPAFYRELEHLIQVKSEDLNSSKF
ncbi:hypothetical protein DXA67_16745 [Bacteroides fragilis]|uniref:Uncharacterized protein n=1 Tax=Bacteroides fragilis TaxID=817 RepID=A0A413JT22_BACFG|nr:hypothetical protein DXA67_16745 [Bacteroides fragilis]RGY64822.1 hypothetical protein DXA27_20885 [Bacteroides fragilis]